MVNHLYVSGFCGGQCHWNDDNRRGNKDFVLAVVVVQRRRGRRRSSSKPLDGRRPQISYHGVHFFGSRAVDPRRDRETSFTALLFYLVAAAATIGRRGPAGALMIRQAPIIVWMPTGPWLLWLPAHRTLVGQRTLNIRSDACNVPTPAFVCSPAGTHCHHIWRCVVHCLITNPKGRRRRRRQREQLERRYR